MPVRPAPCAEAERLALIGGNADGDYGDGDETGGPSDDTEPDQNDGATIAMTWNWNAEEVITGYDTASDTFDFDHVPSHMIGVSEVGDDRVFKILNNGGHRARRRRRGRRPARRTGCR
ncbi:MAG: hypothetical protein GDA49_13900 [Rhodospirillales bacterium]|nr:hypothetical protein [Rhodospirillales bacterium]